MSSEVNTSDAAKGLARGGTVAVVGAGTMGSGIAQAAALAGHPVLLFDAQSAVALEAVAAIRRRISGLAEKGRLSEEQAKEAGERLRHAPATGHLVDAQLVVEAIVEDAQVKIDLFKTLESIVGENCILATNTSSISINRLACELRKPDRFAGMHFFNPVHMMRLVEVVSGFSTGRDIAETIFQTAKAWGKTPIHVSSSPGFVVNRIARPYYAEALTLLTERAGSPATIDAIMRDCGGFRMGPFELMDLIGMDVNFAVTQSVYEAYFFDSRYRPSALQREMVSAGRLGRKSGHGFYVYDRGAGTLAPHCEDLQGYRPAHIAIDQSSAFGAALKKRLTPAFSSRPLGTHGDGRVIEIDEASAYLSDGRTANRRGHENGVQNTVLIDLALNYETTPRLAVTHSDACSGMAFMAVVAVLQGAGYVVSKIDDAPGMALTRTVAMLANEASDTVAQGVCTTEAADIAMELGMNYPAGPLAWAETIGHSRICTILTHLGNHYGGERYRISPRLQRLAMGAAQAEMIALNGEERHSTSLNET